VAVSFPSLILESVGWLLNIEIDIHKYGNAGIGNQSASYFDFYIQENEDYYLKFPLIALMICSIILLVPTTIILLTVLSWRLKTKNVQTGNHTSEITGDHSTKIVSGTATVEHSIAGGAITTSIVGASEETIDKTLTGDITETITTVGNITQTINAIEYTVTNTSPTYKSTNTGNSDSFKLAMKTETVLGLVNDNFIGGKIESFTGMKTTMTTAGEVTIGKAADLRKNLSKIDEAATAIEKHQSKIVDGAIAMFKSKINMLG
jgi:hypothetical protein